MQEKQRRQILAVRTLILRTGQLLLVGHQDAKTGRIWWMAPGGRVSPEETVIAAAVREVKEETGLDAAVERLVYWMEWVSEKSYCLELYFLGRMIGGTLTVGTDPEFADGQQVIFDARFFDLNELQEFPVYPEIFKTMLAEHWSQGFPTGAMYLGLSKPNLPR